MNILSKKEQRSIYGGNAWDSFVAKVYYAYEGIKRILS